MPWALHLPSRPVAFTGCRSACPPRHDSAEAWALREAIHPRGIPRGGDFPPGEANLDSGLSWPKPVPPTRPAAAVRCWSRCANTAGASRAACSSASRCSTRWRSGGRASRPIPPTCWAICWARTCCCSGTTATAASAGTCVGSTSSRTRWRSWAWGCSGRWSCWRSSAASPGAPRCRRRWAWSWWRRARWPSACRWAPRSWADSTERRRRRRTGSGWSPRTTSPASSSSRSVAQCCSPPTWRPRRRS